MPQLTTVRVSDIKPDPDNIRDNAADSDIASLAADIAEHGLLQPLVVYPDDSGSLKLSAGHRRLHAITSLGWTDVSVLIRQAPASDIERLDLMAAENLHRRQLNPIEEAKLFQRYLDADIDPRLTQTDIARKIGRGITYVSQRVSLLELSEDMQRRVASGAMTVAGAVKAAKWQRIASGTARSDHGTEHQMSITVPYFTSGHRLHGAAAHRCRTEFHDVALRIGGACGECWERQIRIDAGVDRADADPPPSEGHAPRVRARFTDPMDILRRLTCTRCGCAATERANRRCYVDRDGKRYPFEQHEFVMEVAADVA